MRKNCALVWAGAQNTIAKNATMIVTTARVFILGSLLGFGLLVFDWVGGWMREGKPLPYEIRCILFVGEDIILPLKLFGGWMWTVEDAGPTMRLVRVD